jgi:Cu-Zn family superoxide dismutase
MEVDKGKRLWIAGGRTGMIWVLDAGTGTVVRRLSVPTAGRSLINDVALIGSAAYFTDTTVPTRWRIQTANGAVGEVEAWLDFTGTAVEYAQGSNLNGITATPDGRWLIVVQMTKGLLFRIAVASRAVTMIDTGGEDLSGADGLVLDGDLLYVVRQRAGEIAAVRMSADLTKGTVISRFTDPALTWPATAVKVGADLVVVNTQFNARSSKAPLRPFTLVRVPVTRIAGPAKGR